MRRGAQGRAAPHITKAKWVMEILVARDGTIYGDGNPMRPAAITTMAMARC